MFVKLICKYESLQTKVRVKSLGGGYSHIKRTGLLVRISERNPKGSTKILFCGRGLKFFSPLGGTNSKPKWLNTLKGSKEAPTVNYEPFEAEHP